MSADTDPSLFMSANPNQPTAGVCVPPVVSEQGRRLGEYGIELEAAQKACAYHSDQNIINMCAFDVMAMGDLEVAQISKSY